MRRVCERCGHEKCIDKKFVPYKFLWSYSQYEDCPKGGWPVPQFTPRTMEQAFGDRLGKWPYSKLVKESKLG